MPIDSVSMKDLLEAGFHFGHQTRRWNPKMARYIYMERNDIYIIDLQKTVRAMRRAYKFLRDTARMGGKVLLVSTKKQAQEIIRDEAQRAGMYHINQRWLGGLLTNFTTISRRVAHMKSLEKMSSEGQFDYLTKKEEGRVKKQAARLNKYLSGIKDMTNLPDAVYIVDPRREHIALKEAQRLHIPIVAIVDTNCDPENIDYPIPGNDDAIRAIKIMTSYLVDGMVEGLGMRQTTGSVEAKDESATAAAVAPAPAAPAKDHPKAEARAPRSVRVVASASPDEGAAAPGDDKADA
jgi:small subunit ribosomal protein S2